MEKRKPHYLLVRAKSLIEEGAYRVSRTALQCAARDFGYVKASQLADCVLRLVPGDFYKSMTTLHDSTIWQDVYRPEIDGTTVYVKIQILKPLPWSSPSKRWRKNKMREKKWIDCPVCGAKNSMRTRKNLSERFIPAGYPPLDIPDLDGQFCTACGDGFWSLKSERCIARLLSEHRAAHDGTRVVAAELSSVKEAAETLHVTVQGVHKMMDEGRLRYVVAGGMRLPIRKDVTEKVAFRAGV